MTDKLTEADRLWTQIQEATRALVQPGWAHALCLRFYDKSGDVVVLWCGPHQFFAIDGKGVTESRARTFITLYIAAQHSGGVT